MRATTPHPLIDVAIEPKLTADANRLVAALAALRDDDPDLSVVTDENSGQTIVGGLSEAHLDAIVGRLRVTDKIDVNIGAPQVAYRETLTRRVEQDYTHKTQAGGTGQFARVKIVFEPNDTGAGNVFESRIVAGAVPNDYIRDIQKGIDSVMGAGVLAGFPVVDVKATLIDGAFHDMGSSVPAFEIAARAAFREALQKGGSVLLEPIMKVEVVTPEDYTGSVIGDLNSRRGQIQGQDMRGDANVINAMVPLASMFGYVNTLHSMSEGRATFTMRFAYYAPVPKSGGDDRPPAAAALRA